MSLKSERKKHVKAEKQAAAIPDTTNRVEREDRWGFVYPEGYSEEVITAADGSELVKSQFVGMIVDTSLPPYAKDNVAAVSDVATNWILDQSESRIPGVPEMTKVALFSHRMGISGGVGSGKHTHAMNALNRLRSVLPKNEYRQAWKATFEMLGRLKEVFGVDHLRDPDTAATPEEIIDFYLERRQVSEIVQ
jgi:hypothetical protein